MFVVHELKKCRRDFIILVQPGVPADMFGPFETKAAAEEALVKFGAKADGFSGVVWDGDHPGDCEGFTIRDSELVEGATYGRVLRAFVIEEFNLKSQLE
jgi:hypothetical protein